MLASLFITLKMVVKSLANTNPNILNHSLRPSLLAGVSYLLIILVLSSCSTFKVPFKKSKNSSLSSSAYNEMDERDYADHFAALKLPFLSTPGIKISDTNSKSKKYLEDLVRDIISKNEIFFKKLRGATITILESNSPLHFSFPKGEIFISSGLISKYIKHESMLVGILAFELVRSEKLIYPKQIIIPIGYVPLERIISLNRLTLEEKMEVHKWAHYITVRSGFDGEYYLSWLQTQNRNTADFILQVGDANQINREESLFKAFLIKSSDNEENIILKKNSSKNFYTFINTVRDGEL